MSTKTSGWRQQEIIVELQLASQYFERLSAEIDCGERDPLPGDEWQMAQHIHESILLLQWRLESFSHRRNHIETQHFMPGRTLARQTVTEQAVTEQTIIRQSSSPILHSNSE